MKFLQKISNLFAGSQMGGKEGAFEIAVQCSRCGEVIRTRVDTANDLSAEYDESGKETSYYCRKVLIGKQGCFASIEVILRFDANRNLVERQIAGGNLVKE